MYFYELHNIFYANINKGHKSQSQVPVTRPDAITVLLEVPYCMVTWFDLTIIVMELLLVVVLFTIEFIGPEL